MKNQITPRSAELTELKKEIRDREEILASLKKHTFESMSKWLAEAALQGDALNRVKAAIGHGQWLQWLKVHCPFSHDTAARYISAASNFASVRNLNPEMTHLEIAMQLVRERSEQKEPRCVVAPDLRLLSWAEKFSFGLSRHGFDTWNSGAVDRAKELLEPVARELWPERWTGGDQANTQP